MGKAKSIFLWIKKSKPRLIGVILALLLLIYLGNRFVAGRKSQPQYQTANVELGTITASISASGQILTANVITITSQTNGVVKSVLVNDGDTVTMGQKL